MKLKNTKNSETLIETENTDVIETPEVETVETVETPEVETVETVETPEVETQNQTVETPEVELEVALEEVEEALEEVEEEPILKATGVVNVGKLNVRKEPDKDADVLTIISVGSRFGINLTESTEDFYCINVLVNNEFVSGYCMKEFIDID